MQGEGHEGSVTEAESRRFPPGSGGCLWVWAAVPHPTEDAQDYLQPYTSPDLFFPDEFRLRFCSLLSPGLIGKDPL